MRNRLLGRIVLMLLGGLAGALTVSWSVGQPSVPREFPANRTNVDGKAPPAVRAVNGTAPSAVPIAGATPFKPRALVAFDRFRNLETLPELTRQMVMTAQSGMAWLYRYNQPNGWFMHGYLPAVNQPMEGDHFLHQAMAAFTLARSARFLGDENFVVRANQSVLTLLTGTTVEATAPGVRRPVQPSIVCNRLAAAGLLAMAIYELPDPAADLLVKADELCAFIRQQQRDDGSLSYADAPGEDPLTADPDGVNHYPGPALFALALSQRRQPAAWKTDSFRKAVAYYRERFREHRRPELIPWITAACTEGYLATRDKAFAEFVLEMTDWLCGLQYGESSDACRPLWRGGFKSVAKDKGETAPGIETALYAQSLADACRLVRQMPAPDLRRYDRYRVALVRSLHFLTTLQFTEANTVHIAPSHRHLLVGGFHPTHADGNLRVDQSAAAVSAFIQFLVSGADRAQ